MTLYMAVLCIKSSRSYMPTGKHNSKTLEMCSSFKTAKSTPTVLDSNGSNNKLPRRKCLQPQKGIALEFWRQGVQNPGAAGTCSLRRLQARTLRGPVGLRVEAGCAWLPPVSAPASAMFSVCKFPCSYGETSHWIGALPKLR